MAVDVHPLPFADYGQVRRRRPARQQVFVLDA